MAKFNNNNKVLSFGLDFISIFSFYDNESN